MGVYYVAVVGESFPNRDGSDRQAIIRRLRQGHPITLRHEPDNPYDPSAIAVDSARGQIGYLARTEEAMRDRVLRGAVIELCVMSTARADSGKLGVVLLACTAGENIADEVAIRRLEYP